MPSSQMQSDEWLHFVQLIHNNNVSDKYGDISSIVYKVWVNNISLQQDKFNKLADEQIHFIEEGTLCPCTPL